MSPLRVYAAVPHETTEALETLGTGITGEPLEAVSCELLAVVAGRTPPQGPVDTEALRRHDRVVRDIAARVNAVLPARFGQTVVDRETLVDRIRPRAAELAAALDRVAGCRQMTLRIFGSARAFTDETDAFAPGTEPPADEAGDRAAAGPGARYLRARTHSLDFRLQLPGLAPLCDELAPLVRERRAKRVGRPPLLMTSFDLVPRGREREYLETVARHEQELARASLRVRPSGPWPPYGFAPRWA